MDTQTLLNTLQQMIADVNEVNGTNEKIERIQKFPQLKPFLKLLYDPLSTTGVTSSQLDKYAQKKNLAAPAAKKSKTQRENDLTVLLEKLYRRDYSGNEAKDIILNFITQYPSHKALIYKIIDKDLETRLDVKQLNKAFPNIISEFSVALAKDFESGKTYFDKTKSKTKWLISRKYDGIRCIVKVTGGHVQSFSRNGNHLPALAPLEELVQKYAKSDSFVLDGEVCAIGEDGNENFNEAVSQAKRKSVRMEKFRYYVFDMLTLDEFDSGESKTTLEDRLQRAGTWIEKVNNVEKIRLVTHVEYTPEEFERQQTQASDLGWEGLMVRLNTTYKGKRSNDILKVKKFFTEEYKVLGHEVGPMRIIDPGTGLETTIETLKSVVIEHKANQVNVGSGFTLDERQKFYADPKLIVGKIISVRYFEETPPNDEGKISLRFPTFVTLHGTKRTL